MPAEQPSMSRRLASLFYEALSVVAVLLIGFLIPQAVFSGFGWIAPGRLLWLHVFLLLMLYFVWFWLNGGQTLAMKTWRLRLINAEGGRLRPMQALLRYLAAWPGVMLFGIGILWALIDRDRRFLHDRIAGTSIVYEPD